MGMACAKLLIGPRPLSCQSRFLDMLGRHAWNHVCRMPENLHDLALKGRKRAVTSAYACKGPLSIHWHAFHFLSLAILAIVLILHPIFMQWLNPPNISAGELLSQTNMCRLDKKKFIWALWIFQRSTKARICEKKRALSGMEKSQKISCTQNTSDRFCRWFYFTVCWRIGAQVQAFHMMWPCKEWPATRQYDRVSQSDPSSDSCRFFAACSRQ